MRVPSQADPDARAAPELGAGRQAVRRAFLAMGLVFAGIGSFLSSSYLTYYNYSVTTTITGGGQTSVETRLFYPLQAYLPIAYVAAAVLAGFGLWYSRRLLATNTYFLAAMVWVGLGFFSLISGAVFDAVLSVFPERMFFAYGTSYPVTALYLSTLILVGLTAFGPSAIGVWVTTKLLSARRKEVMMIFGLGTALTFLSLLSVQNDATTGLSGILYQRGFPIQWLGLPRGLLAVAPGWYPANSFTFDLLFWSGCVFAGVAAINLLRRRSETTWHE